MMAGPGTVAATVDGMDLSERVEQKAVETGFAGIVRVDRGGTTDLSAAYGLADRRHGIPKTPDHQLATASGSKGMTALAVMSLVEDGTLTLGTTARSLLGDDLPLIADDVTIEHLLAHPSGIGDYLDEEHGVHDHRLRAGGRRARARDHRAVPRDPRRVPHRVPRR